MNEEIKKYLEPGKKNIILIYILFLCGAVTYLTPIVGGVLAFLNINFKDQKWHSHYVFALRSFIFGLIGMFIATIIAFASVTSTVFFFILPFAYTIVYAWFLIRIVIALRFILEDAAHPNPLTFWIK
ncbi:MAG: hypothetical protein J0L79_00635 [Rickettsiales bacterium]|jgi:uncharacterized membrane protein|nr:hypothetical protein [Rickettsiales bacterium]